MKRKIIKIDEERCNGCGICVTACHEGALEIIDGKAKLVSESYCDGLGSCLPGCPMDAITIEEREADPFSEEEIVKKSSKPAPFVCPGTMSRRIERDSSEKVDISLPLKSQLNQWPCQIKLVPPNAPYFNNANLLIAADCTAFAYADIHNKYMKNKITLIGCPKLDDIDYSEKLIQILKINDIKSITVLRMEVPCCGGIVQAVKKALMESGKVIPWNIVVITTDGQIKED